jgi:hypothetical protein
VSDETNRILIDNLKEKAADHSRRLSDIEEEIWGYPKGKGEGLLQKVRDNNRKWAIVGSIVVFLGALVGRSIGKVYDKFVLDWVYNSPSSKWLQEQQRPKVKIYRIYQKKQPEIPK